MTCDYDNQVRNRRVSYLGAGWVGKSTLVDIHVTRRSLTPSGPSLVTYARVRHVSGVPRSVNTRAVTTEFRLAAATARVTSVSAVDSVVARGASTSVRPRQVLTRGTILTSQVRNVVEPNSQSVRNPHFALEYNSSSRIITSI